MADLSKKSRSKEAGARTITTRNIDASFQLKEDAEFYEVFKERIPASTHWDHLNMVEVTIDPYLFQRVLVLKKPFIDVLNSPTELIETAKSGIPVDEFAQIIGSTPFSLAEWEVFLKLSKSEISQKEVFNQAQTEIILQIAQLQVLGEDVFGSRENFAVWASTPSLILEGKRPKDFMDSTFGIQMLKTELYRIEYGILA